MKRHILTISVFAISLISVFAFATIPQPINAQSGFGTTIRSTPSNPQPYEIFNVGLSSSETDLSRANISWYINNSLGLTGIGKIGFSSQTGPVGTQFNIRAVIETVGGGEIEKSIIVRPQGIDLLWSAHTYTPPFYKGLPLASSASYVIITAIPDMVDAAGNKIKPEELVYTWSQSGIVLGSASGYGKQTVVLENAQLLQNKLTVNVAVSSLNNTVAANGAITIPLSTPEVIFYNKHSLDGVLYNQSLERPVVGSEEFVVRAEPYYFSKDDVANKRLSYLWEVSGIEINTSKFPNKNEIAFQSDGKEGEVYVEVNVLNDNLPLRILQKALGELTFIIN